jgi:uncharacterized membrane protein
MTDLYPAVMVVADADNDAWFDHMGGWAGWWVIFPIVMMIFMVLMMSRMFFSWRRGSGGGSGMGPMRMGPMGMMGGHGDENQTADDSALEVLRRRYAAGELSDEQFDAMRRKLEEPSP